MVKDRRALRRHHGVVDPDLRAGDEAIAVAVAAEREVGVRMVANFPTRDQPDLAAVDRGQPPDACAPDVAPLPSPEPMLAAGRLAHRLQVRRPPRHPRAFLHPTPRPERPPPPPAVPDEPHFVAGG